MDMKKALQNELKSGVSERVSTSVSSNAIKPNGCNMTNVLNASEKDVDPKVKASTIVMDDVNLKYLKHVILKFLTSREVRSFDANSDKKKRVIKNLHGFFFSIRWKPGI